MRAQQETATNESLYGYVGKVTGSRLGGPLCVAHPSWPESNWLAGWMGVS
jgi:hypothetical protein